MTIGMHDFHGTSFRLLIVITHEELLSEKLKKKMTDICFIFSKCETVCFDRWHLMIYDTYELTKIHDLDCGKLFDIELSCFVIK